MLERANQALLDENPAAALPLYEALVCEHDLAIAPICHNAALCLEIAQQYEDAIAAYGRVLQDVPTYVRSLLGTANCHRHLGRHDESRDWLLRARDADPSWPQAHFLLSASYLRTNQIDEACQAALLGFECSAAVHARDTEHYVQTYYDPMTPSVYTHRNGSATLLDFLYSESVPEATILALHNMFGAALTQMALSSPPRPHPQPGRPRLGYVSEHFRHGSVMSNWLPLAEHHGDRFEVFCYHVGLSRAACTADRVTDRVAKRFGKNFKVVPGVVEAAYAIAADTLDVLISLDGHTGTQVALQVLAVKGLAPLQIDYLGYPATTGVEEVGYKIVDAVTDPPGESEKMYTEHLLRLPGCFLCWSPLRPMTAATRGPSAHVKLLSANNWKKCGPSFLAACAEVLRRVPDAELYFKSSLHERAEELFDAFVAERFDPDVRSRVKFLPYTEDPDEHLIQTARFDLALDSFPYSGTVTTLECLYAGVPVVTVRGLTHRGRVSASILHEIGHPELVAGDVAEYIDKAVALASDPEQLHRLKDVRVALEGSGIMDHQAFARKFEDLLLRTWKQTNTWEWSQKNLAA